MLQRFTKVIAIGAVTLALSTTSVVPPPQPAVAAELTREYFDTKIGELKKTIEDTNGDLKKTIENGTAQIVAAINKAPTTEPHHPTHAPIKVVLVEKPVHVPHRPHWCCRPPPPPCPPWGWGW